MIKSTACCQRQLSTMRLFTMMQKRGQGQKTQEIRKILALSQCSSSQNDDILAALAAFRLNYPLDPQGCMNLLKYESSGDTILHCSARCGNFAVTQHLLEYFSPNCRNYDNKTPLHEAAQFGQVEVALLLLQSGADVNALKKSDWTPLMLACTKLQKNTDNAIKTHQRLALVKLLLENGAVVSFQNKDGWTALHLAAREGDVGLVEILLQHAGTLNLPELRTTNGNTALHIAALHQHAAVFNTLCHADQNGLQCLYYQSNQGNYALHEAVLSKSVEMFQFVLPFYLKNQTNTHIGLPQLVNNLGYNIFHLACYIGHEDVLHCCFALSNPSESIFNTCMTMLTKDGQNCLHLAALNKMWATYKFCLANGVSEEVRDKFGRTPCDYNKCPQ